MLIIELFLAGGIVMYPLLGFSIVAIALIIERLVFWFRVNRRQRRVARDVLRTYPHDFDSALLKLKKNHAFRLTLEGATQAELPMLRRFNSIFDMIITAAPLLGLLGTVLGLIQSFAALDLAGGGSESALQVNGLGLPTGWVKAIASAVVILLAGSAVALAGPIGFVGLVVPHIVRFGVGVDYRWILPYAAILGAILVSLADLAARLVIKPQELPVGIMMALVGAPFFIYLARSKVNQ